MAAVVVEIVVVVEEIVVVVEMVVCISPIKASAVATAGDSIRSIDGVFIEKFERKSANVTPAGRFASKSATGISEGFMGKLLVLVLDMIYKCVICNNLNVRNGNKY